MVAGGFDEGVADGEGGVAGTETSGRLGRGLGTEPVDDVGLWLGEALSQAVGVGDAEAGSDAAESDAAEWDVASDEAVVAGEPVAVGAPVPDALGELVGLAESLGGGEPVQGFAEAVASAAIPGLAGMISSAPSATVPVATAPTTDAADRFLRACFGTVLKPPAFAVPCNSDHAPRRAHVPP